MEIIEKYQFFYTVFVFHFSTCLLSFSNLRGETNKISTVMMVAF